MTTDEIYGVDLDTYLTETGVTLSMLRQILEAERMMLQKHKERLGKVYRSLPYLHDDTTRITEQIHDLAKRIKRKDDKLKRFKMEEHI